MFRKGAWTFLAAAILLAGACSAPEQQTPPSVAEPPEPKDAPASAAGGLAGTSWQLVKFEGGDGTVLTPDDKSKYTIAFGLDGRVSVRIDCNRGSGTWQSAAPPQLEFGPLTLTRVACAPAPLNERMERDWPYVRSYVMRDGHLFMALMADAGIYEFEPMAAAP
jgi:para-nitrobenzyl esterase